MSSNPYDSSIPTSQVYSPDPYQRDQLNDPMLKEVMLSMARWQTFFVVLGSVTVGLVFGYLAIVVFMSLASGMRGIGVAEMVASFLTAVLVLLIYGLPTFKLFRAAAKARSCVLRSTSFTEAMIAQRGFWRTAGIIVAIAIVLYVLFFVMAIGLASSRFFL